MEYQDTRGAIERSQDMVKINKHFIRYIFLISVIFGLAISSAACNKKEKGKAVPKEAVTIGVASIVMSSPIIIAQEKGYFEENGLKVTIKPYPSGKKAIAGAFAGENDIATTAELPIMFESFVRNDFNVIATFTHSYKDIKVIARKDLGINTPADLKGKRVGFIEKTGTHFFSYVYFTEHKIDPSTLKISYYAPSELPDKLKLGLVDAIIAFEPIAYQALAKSPGQAIMLPVSNLFRNTFNLAARKDWTAQHPETLKKIIRAVDKAIEFTKKNKNESIVLVANYLKLPREYLFSVWDDHVFQLSLDNYMLTTIEDEARWAIKNRFVDTRAVPNYLDFVYLDAMKAVKPEAVSIVK